jgi:hypothetical protein
MSISISAFGPEPLLLLPELLVSKPELWVNITKDGLGTHEVSLSMY